MWELYYVNYKRAEGGRPTVGWINRAIPTFNAHYCISIGEVSPDVCNVLVADHPNYKNGGPEEVSRFARDHPNLPIIVTAFMGFPIRLQKDPKIPNVYYLSRTRLLDRSFFPELEKLLTKYQSFNKV